jgi:hypothetical protein
MRNFFVADKSGLEFFSPKNSFLTYFFYLKHHRNRDKPIYGLENNPKNKNQLKLRYVFSRTLKVKKHLI